jgi:hypothetical protein
MFYNVYIPYNIEGKITLFWLADDRGLLFFISQEGTIACARRFHFLNNFAFYVINK